LVELPKINELFAIEDRPVPPLVPLSGVDRDKLFAVIETARVELAVMVTLVELAIKAPPIP
jgi:hypothetical protein